MAATADVEEEVTASDDEESRSGTNRDVIVDIDGTLADVTHRLRHIRGRRKKWKKFFELMTEDKPVERIIDQVAEMARDHNIYIVSGRPEDYRRETEEWLKLHQVPYQALFMRRAGDFRPDDVVKQEILDERLDKENIELVIEDRPRVIRMWKRNGLNVQDVGTGEEF